MVTWLWSWDFYFCFLGNSLHTPVCEPCFLAWVLTAGFCTGKSFQYCHLQSWRNCLVIKRSGSKSSAKYCMRYWVAIFQARTSKICALELVACKLAQVIIRKKKTVWYHLQHCNSYMAGQEWILLSDLLLIKLHIFTHFFYLLEMLLQYKDYHFWEHILSQLFILPISVISYFWLIYY